MRHTKTIILSSMIIFFLLGTSLHTVKANTTTEENIQSTNQIENTKDNEQVADEEKKQETQDEAHVQEKKESEQESVKMEANDLERNEAEKGNEDTEVKEDEENSVDNETPSEDEQEKESDDLKVEDKEPADKKPARMLSTNKTVDVLEKGVKDPQVIRLKEQLTKLGFANFKTPNKYYGPKTKRAVKDFQEYYGLKVTGVADAKTVEKIDRIANSPLQKGKRHQDTISMKEDLIVLDYLYLKNPNTYFGSQTEKAVKAFQSDHGLKVTGIADPVTVEKLQSEADAPLQKGMSRSDAVGLKEQLTKLGFANFKTPNKYYGPKTERAVKDFQEYYGLKVTGVADDKTVEKIDRIANSPLQKGKRHQDTISLKEDLIVLDYLDLNNPNTYFGSQTEKAVKAFQSDQGLKVTGIADPVTVEKLQSEADAPLQKGMSRSDAVELKEQLTKLGFANFKTPNKYYGPKTKRAVKDFQEYYGLKVTGVADAKTVEKIDRIANSPLQKGKRHQDTISLKEDLIVLDYLDLNNPNTYFGSQTEKAVKAFQSDHGLKVTGIADPVTVEKLQSEADAPLQKGMSRSDAVELKEQLTKLGFANFKTPNKYYGPKTERAVKDFQEYYGLKVTGVADAKTVEKIDRIANSPLQKGKRHQDTISLKEDLIVLDYLDLNNPNTYFGTKTANAVTSFQIHFGLKANGIAEEKTLAKIEEILSSNLQKGNSSEEIKKLKEDLVALGFASFKNPNKYFGSKTEQAVKDFQKNKGLPISGIADEVTLKEIEQAMKEMQYTHYNLSLEEAVTIQMKAKPQTDKDYAYVSKTYINDNQTVTASKLNVRSGAGTKSSIVGTLNEGDKVNIISEYKGWYIIEFDGSSQWVDASPQDVEYYLNPNNFLSDTKQRFQFLDLSKGSAASAVDLNKFLAGKGILEGKGASFIRASNLHGVNDIYLLSHALLETGNGTSKLATGVQVGEDKTGKLVLVDSKNKSSLKNVKTVYNMYGIGAYDNCAVECGAKYAYENDWTTPERAIVRGATFIGNSYIKSGLNTLYKMRWNPEAMAATNAYGKQYATDIGWASKQVNSMFNLYQQIQNHTMHLDIPVYK